MCFIRVWIAYWQGQASQQVSVTTIAQPLFFWHRFVFVHNNQKQKETIKDGKEEKQQINI